jgi:hypothetical protein
MIHVLQGGSNAQMTMQPCHIYCKFHGCQVWGQYTQPTMRYKQGSLWLLRSTTLEPHSLDSLA